MVALHIPTVALVGNPNTGKTTLFNALAGMNQRVGNYPGVTVEKKTGRMRHGQQSFDIVDLPGTYSLAPRSPDEMVAVDVILGRAECREIFERPRGLKLAHRVRAPALIVHGALDGTVAPSGSRRLLRELASPHKELHILPRSGHVLPLDVEADEVCGSVAQFFHSQGAEDG